MSAIANQWTGDGLPDGTVLTSANVNNAGNGSTVSGAFTTGTATMVTDGHGFRVQTDSTGAIRRLDCTVSGTAVRLQLKVTVGALPTAASSYLATVRDASQNLAWLFLTVGGAIGVNVLGGGVAIAPAPAIAAGSTLLIDLVLAQSASPTSTNGRVFMRIRNLTNPSWNTTGEYFADSGYAVNLGTAAMATVRYGKMQAETLPGAGVLYEFPGWEAITVNSSHTSEAQAKAYFADAPVASAPLDDPVVTVSGFKNPTTVGGSDGTITITWPPVSGAHHYEAAIAAGAVTGGFVATDTAATSPKTFTGLQAGTYTVAVRAKATA